MIACFEQNYTFLFKPVTYISVNSNQIVSKPSQSRVNFSRRSQQGVTTLYFKQNCTFSSIFPSILNGLPSNLHKVGLIFRDDRNKGTPPKCFKQNYTFYSNPSYASQSILNGLSPNLHKLGLIF